MATFVLDSTRYKYFSDYKKYGESLYFNKKNNSLFQKGWVARFFSIFVNESEKKMISYTDSSIKPSLNYRVLTTSYIFEKSFFSALSVRSIDVTWRNKEEIEEFINANTFLKDYLALSQRVLKTVFNGFAIEIALITDPELEKSNQTLFVFIKTSLPVDEALKKLDIADEKIFSELDRNVPFQIDVRF